MKKRMLFWQFFGTHILILFASIGFVALYTWHASRVSFHRQWVRELEIQSRLVAALLPDDNGSVDERLIAGFFERLGKVDENRFTLILPDGKVVGDSDADSKLMMSHIDRPEVIQAMKSGQGMSRRYSSSIGKQMLYLAQRVPREGPMRVIVRVAVPVQTMSRERNAADRVLLVFLLVVFSSTLMLSYGAARRIIGPVSDLQKGLKRIGEGELAYRLSIPAVPHLAELARSINQTAERLQKDMLALDEERNLRTLILANMSRGVIALDQRHAILDMNDSAKRLLNLSIPSPEGALIGEVVRYPEILSLIEKSERSETLIEKEMTTGGDNEVLLNLRASPLKDVAGERIGTLLMLGDVTLLRRLETVRQDFVANVSHELRTPVTSIKGFAETLLDGAVKDAETAERFLKIIVRQSNQLESIIRDLLELSRLENRSAQTLDRQMTPVAELLRNSVELCQGRADARGVALAVSCEDGLSAVVHAGLMEQALTNLIDNAITYGSSGSKNAKVDIEAVSDGLSIRITVRDYGVGIEHKHLDRLFERFYRVDKGRSRELGGTGLGLAIVKHIVLMHNGTVGVDSELGKGSVFTIRLPV